MADIVERLLGAKGVIPRRGLDAVLDDGAAEIVRLRAALEWYIENSPPEMVGRAVRKFGVYRGALACRHQTSRTNNDAR